MPYYFECPYCDVQIPVTYGAIEDLERNCTYCGEDVCTDCCPNGLCDDCYHAAEDFTSEGEGRYELVD
jgi:hypothetical protein